MHARAGKITNIRDHEDGKHAEITVTHGKRKRSKHAPEGQVAPLESYGQHRSHVTMSKADAANYKLGQKVNAGIEANDTDGDDDMDYGDEEGQNGAAPAAKSIPGKQSGVTSVKPSTKPSKGKSKFLAAMRTKAK